MYDDIENSERRRSPFCYLLQTNTEYPVEVDTSDDSERIMRHRHLTTWDQVRYAIDLLHKTHYIVRGSKPNIGKPEIRFQSVVFVCYFGHKKKAEGPWSEVKRLINCYYAHFNRSKFTGCKAMFCLRYDINRYIID
ncbi:hypothetical protein Smp_125470 [Schistosoma mansoni]|uniref:hypothetical protein n=1 Tax=Schistosoma mansoni TaxID=6183 RepID=UPI0001A63549|nr:hypothetical protein Smp_125470 [Schistosoma mansoni]|eukprot:XP_018650513.1 hypothetical protein Smp_125470 [Schistosoma mansoni]